MYRGVFYDSGENRKSCAQRGHKPGRVGKYFILASGSDEALGSVRKVHYLEDLSKANDLRTTRWSKKREGQNGGGIGGQRFAGEVVGGLHG